MDNIEEDINEIMDYIKDLKEENRKQKEILDILKKHLIKVNVRNGKIFSIDIHSFVKEEIKDYLKIKEWLDNDK